MSEIEKYRGIYSSSSYSSYGHSNHGKASMSLWDSWAVSSVVDVGCGHNEFINELRKWPRKWKFVAGVDFACPSADIRALATDLPFYDKQFDLLTSFDCLEHLLPEEVETALMEFSRVSRGFVFSIAYVPSKITWKGQNLHPTVQDKNWWIARLIASGASLVNQSGRYLYGQWGENSLTKAPPGIGKSIILVGNGPSVTQKELGAKIDAFDEVVRFNSFKIKGFEANSGKKVTLWSTFGHGVVPQDNIKPRRMIIRGNAKAAYRASEVWRIPIESFQAWQKTLQALTRVEPEKVMPSSGFLLLNWLLESGVPTVHLVGFDHFSKEKTGQHHYWIKSSFKPPKEHNGSAEAMIISGHVATGRVVYL